MRANCLHLVIIAIACTLVISCKRETIEFTTDPLSEYVPLQSGKYFIYRLDSTVFTGSGRFTEVHSYQEKHEIDAPFTDLLGRPGYRIFRFLRDTAGTQPWVSAGTYYITPTETTVEVNENNMRVVKLALPISSGFRWKPNLHLPDEPFGSLYSFQNEFDMYDWDNTYGNITGTEEINGKTYNNVIVVEGVNRASNVPVTDPGSYGYIDYQVSKYAKGLGLIYEEWIMWDYQPPASGSSTVGFKTGFGMMRSLIDHN